MSEKYAAYIRYLKSRHWENLRSEKLEQSPTCCCCDRRTRLHVHHVRYKNLKDCLIEDLAVLCVDHHSALHLASKIFKVNLVGVNEAEIKALVDRLRQMDDGELLAARKASRISKEHKSSEDRKRSKILRTIKKFQNKIKRLEEELKKLPLSPYPNQYGVQ